jgi:hypothetical protein
MKQPRHIDVFNGDADGICSLIQLRLAEPCEKTELVTGVKRDITLLDRVSAQDGDLITVLDISLDRNRADVDRLLTLGASIRYFDHHYSGGFVTKRTSFHPYIDESNNICTSLIVNRYLKEQHKLWAVVGAFGDNLIHVAEKYCLEMGVSSTDISRLQKLGELLNYNGYGSRLEDLHFHPAELFESLRQSDNPLEISRESKIVETLSAGYLSDFESANQLKAEYCTPTVAVFKFPDKMWSRRILGIVANNLVQTYPKRNHLLICPDGNGFLTISVRMAKENPKGASSFCRRYPQGGGRESAAGINALPLEMENDLITDFINTWG